MQCNKEGKNNKKLNKFLPPSAWRDKCDDGVKCQARVTSDCYFELCFAEPTSAFSNEASSLQPTLHYLRRYGFIPITPVN